MRAIHLGVNDKYQLLESFNKWRPIAHPEKEGMLRHGYFYVDNESVVYQGWDGRPYPGRSPRMIPLKKYPFLKEDDLLEMIIEEVDFDRLPYPYSQIEVDPTVPKNWIVVHVQEDPWMFVNDYAAWGSKKKISGGWEIINKVVHAKSLTRSFVFGVFLDYGLNKYGITKIKLNEW